MRIPSGVTDQYIYFIAVDATDLETRETGLSSFTVYRSRNGGAAAAMTTPTVNEVDATNMPGVYELLLDEDMTIDAGDDSQEMAFHITHAGMAPVTRTIELYRPKITAGRTLSIDADGDMPWNADWDAEVQSEVNDALVALHLDHLLAADYDPAAKPGTATALLNELVESDGGVSRFTTNALEQAWQAATRVLTAGTNIALAKGTGVTGFNDLDAAGVRTAVGLAAANLDTQLSAIDTVVDAIKVVSDALGSAAATKLAQTMAGAIAGAAATGTLSTTQATTDLTGYADDQLIGRTLVVTSGAADGEATEITDYASTGGTLTFNALTTAMADADTFVIV